MFILNNTSSASLTLYKVEKSAKLVFSLPKKQIHHLVCSIGSLCSSTFTNRHKHSNMYIHSEYRYRRCSILVALFDLCCLANFSYNDVYNNAGTTIMILMLHVLCKNIKNWWTKIKLCNFFLKKNEHGGKWFLNWNVVKWIEIQLLYFDYVHVVQITRHLKNTPKMRQGCLLFPISFSNKSS